MFGVWLLVVAVLAAADVQGAPGSRDRRSDDDPALLAADVEGAPGSRVRRSDDDPALLAADVEGAPGSRVRRSDDDPALLTEGAPGSRVRRSDDDPALLAVVNGHSQLLAQHGAQVTALQNTVAQLQQQLQQQHDNASLQVAVHARLSNDNHAHVNNGQLIKFDMVLTNQGAAYDPATGVFTAPVSGLYVFLFSTRAIDAAHLGSVYLHVDGYNQVYVDDRDEMATGHAAFHLNGGDKAWVASNGDDRFVYSFNTMFTAFLVNPDW